MNPGTERLHAQLDALTKALQVFSDPVVDDLPGLRLTRETLIERQQHVRQQITKVETAALTVTIRGEVVADGGLPADLAVRLLDGLTAAVSAAGTSAVAALPVPPPPEQAAAALRLHVVEVEGDDGAARLRLQRPPGALGAQLTDPENGRLVVERAVGAIVALLAAAEDDDDLGSALGDAGTDVTDALRGLADVVAGEAIVATFDWQPSDGDGRSTSFSRPAAQRLQAAIAHH